MEYYTCIRMFIHFGRTVRSGRLSPLIEGEYRAPAAARELTIPTGITFGAVRWIR
jgi:hypothetical protein